MQTIGTSNLGITKHPLIIVLLIILIHFVIAKGSFKAHANDRYNTRKDDDLITHLPGQPSNVTFKQYSGYIVVDPKAGRALFYYFVEATSEPHLKPLTLWLNGGPGCSSLGYGAFQELGPFRPNGYGRGLLLNPHSWNKVSNLLFLESPAGVGFSYSNTSSDMTTNDFKTAEDSLSFLLGWFKKFPEYESRDFFLTGESYAGHYIPQLASQLIEYNKRNKRRVFNLQGVAIGNPCLKDPIDTYARYVYLWSHGVYSDETFKGISQTCNFNYYNDFEFDNETQACELYLQKSEQEVGGFLDYYDIDADICYSSIVQQQLRLMEKVHKFSLGVDVCMESEIEFYMNLPEVQQALHAHINHLNYNWSTCSSSLNYSNGDKMDIDMTRYLEEILKYGVRLWVYSGDLDSVIPFLGTRNVVSQLARSMNFPNVEPYRAWYKRGQIAGWTTQHGNLTFATIRGAGHMVPMTQPSRALLLFENFLLGRPLPSSAKAQP